MVDGLQLPLERPAAAAILLALIGLRSATRDQLAQATRLSPAAVTRAVRPLLDAGFLTEDPGNAAGVGRPVRPVRPDPSSACFLGIKITNDTVVAAVVDLLGETRALRSVTLGDHDPEAVAAQLGLLGQEVLAGSGLVPERCLAACVALSGEAVPRTGEVRFSPFLGWRGVPFAALLADRLPMPTMIDNDVRVLTRMEELIGVGSDGRSFVLVTVGAGIGCGICVGGEVLEGAYGVAGEFGHVAVRGNDRECYCGGRGCLEMIAADPALTRPGVDPMAAVAAAGTALGEAIAGVVNLVGPARVVFTGEQVDAEDPRLSHLRTAFARQAYGSAADVEIVIRPHPFEDWARAAGVTALQHYVRSRGRLTTAAPRRRARTSSPR